MIDKIGLAAHRLNDVRNLLHQITISPNFFILHDANLTDGPRLLERHWNLCRSLATTANSTFLANDVAYETIWKEVHNQPMIMVGRLHANWNVSRTSTALTEQLVLSELKVDGLWHPKYTYPKAVAKVLPVAAHPAYFVESHANTSVSDALRWLGVGVDARDHGAAPSSPLGMRDQAITLKRTGPNTFTLAAFGGTQPYVFTIVSQSTGTLFSISGDTLTVDATQITQAGGTEYSVTIKVTDAAMNTDTAIITLDSSS